MYIPYMFVCVCVCVYAQVTVATKMMPAMLHDGKTDAQTVEKAVDASLEVLSLARSLSLSLWRARALL